jgi:anti-sigma B factor antagonist
MPDIQVDVEYKGDNEEIAIISAKGFIDTTTAPDLEKKLEEQLALNKYKIIVNLESIDYVSSAGWGVFVSEIREIRENNGDLVLVNMSSDVYDVYELMEFSSILKSFDGIDSAVSNFTGKREDAERPRPEPQRIELPQPASPPHAEVRNEQQTETIQETPSHASPPSEDPYLLAKTSLGKRIINVIVDNPYFEIKEIMKALRLPQYGGIKAGGGAVKKELREMDLLDKQKRFELALKGKR